MIGLVIAIIAIVGIKIACEGTEEVLHGITEVAKAIGKPAITAGVLGLLASGVFALYYYFKKPTKEEIKAP